MGAALATTAWGGWYSYRASKAALNMLVKTASSEVARTYPQVLLLALHPGTVNSALSASFKGGGAPSSRCRGGFVAGAGWVASGGNGRVLCVQRGQAAVVVAPVRAMGIAIVLIPHVPVY